jgi:hypothetical protein
MSTSRLTYTFYMTRMSQKYGSFRYQLSTIADMATQNLIAL